MQHFTDFSFSIEGCFSVQKQWMSLKLHDGLPQGSRVNIDIPSNPECLGNAEHAFWRECWDFCQQKSRKQTELLSSVDSDLSELAYGRTLFETFIKGDLRMAFYRTLGSTQYKRQEGLRLGVIFPKLKEENASFHHIPWELLGEPYANNKRCFLMNANRSLVRILETDNQGSNSPLAIDGPLRILMIQASGDEHQGLTSLEYEWGALERSAVEGVVEVERLQDASLEEFVQKLNQKTWHVLHFSGHASVDEQGSCFNFVQKFMSMNHDARSMQQLGAEIEGHGVRLVVMNVCGAALHPDRERFHGAPLCELLSCSDVPAMIYPRFPWKSNMAIRFVEAFYRGIQENWHIEKGLFAARRALQRDFQFDWHFLALYAQHDAYPSLPSLLKMKASKQVREPSDWIEKHVSHKRLFNMVFQRIPSGDGVAGSAPGEVVGVPEEDLPLRQVRVAQDFFMAQTPLTCGQFAEITRLAEKHNVDLPFDWCTYAPPAPGNLDLPLTQVSFGRAETILEVMQQLQPGFSFRLPSEDEWEYAARAGSRVGTLLKQRQDAWQLGPASAGQGQIGVPQVRQSEVNTFGLFDMLGLVWEWCANPQQPNPDDGVRPMTAAWGVLRGGSFKSALLDCRFAKRLAAENHRSEPDFGFRPVFSIKESVSQ